MELYHYYYYLTQLLHNTNSCVITVLIINMNEV